jgi:hypothetical protein
MTEVVGSPPHRRRVLSRDYQRASRLHGWELHAYHYGDSHQQLTRKDFDAAITAARNYPTTNPHPPAIAPFLAEHQTKKESKR